MLRKQDCPSPDFSKLLKFLKLLARFSAAAEGHYIRPLHVKPGFSISLLSERIHAFKMYLASTVPAISNQTKGTNLMQPLNPPCLSTPLVQLLQSAVKCQLPELAGHGVNAGSLQQTAL